MTEQTHVTSRAARRSLSGESVQRAPLPAHGQLILLVDNSESSGLVNSSPGAQILLMRRPSSGAACVGK